MSTNIRDGQLPKTGEIEYWELEVFFAGRDRVSKNLKKLLGILKNEGIMVARITRLQEVYGALSCAIMLGIKGLAIEGIIKSVRDSFGKDLVSISSAPRSKEMASLPIPQSMAASLNADSWGILIRSFCETLGSGAFSSLYSAGMEVGEMCARHLAQSPQKRDHFMLLVECLESFQGNGWGNFQILKKGQLPYDLEIRIFDCLECKVTMAISNYESPFTRGQLTGMVRALFNANLTVNEKQCIKNGYPYCAFEVD